MTSNSDDAGALLQVLRWFARQGLRGSRTGDFDRVKTKAIEDLGEVGLPQSVSERAFTAALDRGFLETAWAGGSLRGAWATTITDRGRDYREEFDSELAAGASVANSNSMAKQRGTPPPRPPSLAPERALPAIEQQLTELQAFKGARYRDVESAETEWEHTTQAYLEAAFGSDHTTLVKFRGVHWVGIHIVGDIDPQRDQENFQRRVQGYEALLTSVVKQLKLQLPPDVIKSVYAVGDEYGFYADLSKLMASATIDVLIVDAYLGGKVFDLYVSDVPTAATVRILTNMKTDADVLMVATMFKKSRPLGMRADSQIHDRYVFIDGRGWSIGASIKDAAVKSPTAMVEQSGPALSALRGAYETIWSSAKVIL